MYLIFNCAPVRTLNHLSRCRYYETCILQYLLEWHSVSRIIGTVLSLKLFIIIKKQGKMRNLEDISAPICIHFYGNLLYISFQIVNLNSILYY